VKRITDLFVTTASQPFTSKLIMSNLNWFRYEWVWEKSKATGHASCNSRPLKAHENICVFSKNGNRYFPQLSIGKPYAGRKGIGHKERGVFSTGDFRNDNKGTRYPRTVQKIKNAYYTEGQLHPTQKPVALYEYLIKTYTSEGETIADICMGSGTTGVACVQTGRNFIGIEIEPKYFEIAEKRIKEAQLQIRMEI
jgi:site-specific DNA-methyltransferase (adenine-specific)